MDHLNSKLIETQNLIKVKMNIWWKSKGIQVWNYTLKNYGPLLGKGLNCLKAAKALQGDSLLFTAYQI